jgi:hypothetical protein
MYSNLLTSIIMIIINNNYNILYNFSNINYINIYLLLSFILISLNSTHLHGTSYRQNKMPDYYILFLCKLNFIMLFYSLIINSNLNNLFLLYLPSYLEFSEFKGNRKLYLYNPILKKLSSLFNFIGDYKIINDNKCIENDKQYLIAIHPHGLFPVGTLGTLGLPICKNIKNTIPLLLSNNLFVGIASFCFYIPLIRDLFLFLGAIDCSKPIIEKFIKNGYSIALLIGGAEEAKFSNYGNTNLILKSRKGFLKLAIENNLTLLPIYTLGNNNIYKSYDFDVFNIFYYFKKITGIWFPRGKIIFNKINFITIIGKEIIVEKKIDYNNDNIIDLQNKYINNLNELFEKYKYLDISIKDKSLVIN